MGVRIKQSILVLLGKYFFPREAPWVGRQKIIYLIWSVVVGIIMGAIILVVALWSNTGR